MVNNERSSSQPGVEIAKPISSIPYPSFSEISKYRLPIEYHDHIWQTLPQLSC